MGKYPLLVTIGLALAASSARADFQLTNGFGLGSSANGGTSGFVINVVQTSGTLTDTWKIYALNTSTGDQAGTSNVLALELNYHASGRGLQVRAIDNGDGTISYNFDGTLVTTGGAARGTYASLGFHWFTNEENGDGQPAIANGSIPPLPDPTHFSNVHVIGLANFAEGGVPATSAVNNGLGAQIGQIVYDHGDLISVDGMIGAENGPATVIRFEEPVPEPVALSLGCLCFGLLLRGRRSTC